MGARDLLAELAEAGLSLATEGDRLVIWPASKLTDPMRNALSEAKPELLALLSVPSPERTCMACTHRLRRGTCAEPVAAGLAASFGIRWAPDGHAQRCPAFHSLD